MTPALRASLHAASEHFGAGLTDQALDRLEAYLEVLREWSRTTRLVADAEEELVVHRHVIDSLAVVPHLPPVGPVADIGSGAGFPGVVLGCLRPDLGLLLVESRRKRASFLREVIRRVGLPSVTVAELRAEDLAGAMTHQCRATVSRGLRLGAFLTMSAPLLARGGYAIAMQAGRVFDVEHQVAGHGFRFGLQSVYHLPDGRPRRLVIARL